jgi:hypothetical protein
MFYVNLVFKIKVDLNRIITNFLMHSIYFVNKVSLACQILDYLRKLIVKFWYDFKDYQSATIVIFWINNNRIIGLSGWKVLKTFILISGIPKNCFIFYNINLYLRQFLIIIRWLQINKNSEITWNLNFITFFIIFFGVETSNIFQYFSS